MIESLNPYPEYKTSGVPWVGEIPAHWTTTRGKWLFTKVDRPVRESDEVVTCFRDGTVTLRKNRRLRGFTESLKEIGYQGIRRGDLVIHAMDAFAGAVGVSDSDGKGTPVYAVCEPKPNVNPYFYAYLLREMARSQWIQALATGIRERSTDFRFDAFGSQLLPLPPEDEQCAIVRFLGYVHQQIRRYIRTKKKLVAALDEQQQGTIYRAVTRGLNPHVRSKPSGVDWLGDLPAHWSIRRLKFVADIKTGGRDTVHRQDNGAYPFFVRSQKVERIDSYSYDGEAVLTAGDGAGVAKVFHHHVGKFDYHQRVYKFSDFRAISGRFFFYYLRSVLRFEAFRETAKSTVDSLRLPMLQNLPVALPPIEEQEAIVGAIQAQTASLERAIVAARQEIELMHEYETRLVSDVVGGKLDVRAAAANVPYEGGALATAENDMVLLDGDVDDGDVDDGDLDTALVEAVG